MKKLILFLSGLCLAMAAQSANHTTLTLSFFDNKDLIRYAVFYPAGEECNAGTFETAASITLAQKTFERHTAPQVETLDLSLDPNRNICFLGIWKGTVYSGRGGGDVIYHNFSNIKRVSNITDASGNINASWQDMNNLYSFDVKFENEIKTAIRVQNTGAKEYDIQFFQPHSYKDGECRQKVGDAVSPKAVIKKGTSVVTEVAPLYVDGTNDSFICLRVQAGLYSYTHGPYLVKPNHQFVITNHSTVNYSAYY